MIRLTLLFCALPIAAAAAPKVMTDIAPIHSLTAQVMDGVDTPELLLPPGANPHDFALRPSDADRLSKADIVIWAGHGLTPWLEAPLDSLAADATRLELLETKGWTPLALREDAGHDEDHDETAEDDDHGHDHGDTDPHAWLDPEIAQIWLGIIATELAVADPENADIYVTNAASAAEAISALQAEVAAELAPVSGQSYILPHDGYQYFETHFGLTAAASIAGADARDPGPAHIAELRQHMQEDDIACVLSDAEIGSRWTDLVIEGTAAKTAHLDPVGTNLIPGPDLYAELIRNMGQSFRDCLS